MNMIKLELGIILLFIFIAGIPSKSEAYSIVTDESYFRSLYHNPSEIIDFGSTKQGVLPWNLPPWIHSFDFLRYNTTRNGYEIYGMDQVAFSDQLNIASGIYQFNTYRVGRVIEWNVNLVDPYDRFISPAFLGPYAENFYDHYEINLLVNTSPLALYTGPNHSGFIGIVPINQQENIFSIDSSIAPRIYEIETGFISVPTTVPEPSTFILLGAGLAAVGFLGRRTKK